MLDPLLIEKNTLIIFGVLALSNLVVGLIRKDWYLWPVFVLVVSCAFLWVSLIVLDLAYERYDFFQLYYWRYSYLGLIPMLTLLMYVGFVHEWRNREIILLFIASLLCFWVLGWLLAIIITLSGVGIIIASVVDDSHNNYLHRSFNKS